MPRNTTAAKRKPQRPSTAASEPLLFHRIHALLHTLRSIAQYEDELCTLLHASRTGEAADEVLNAELHSLLDAMPAHEYADDLRQLREALHAPGNAGRAGRDGKRTDKKAARQKKAPVQKQVIAKKSSAKNHPAEKRLAKKAIAARAPKKSAKRKPVRVKKAVKQPTRVAARRQAAASFRSPGARRSRSRR